MTEIPATRTWLAEGEMHSTSVAVRAEALFASALQPSGSPSPDQVRRAAGVHLHPAALARVEFGPIRGRLANPQAECA